MEQKRGVKKQIFENRGGGGAGSRGGCLKRGGWNPPTNYDISLTPKMVKKAIMNHDL